MSRGAKRKQTKQLEDRHLYQFVFAVKPLPVNLAYDFVAKHFVLSSFGDVGCLGLVIHLLLVALLLGVGGHIWGNES